MYSVTPISAFESTRLDVTRPYQFGSSQSKLVKLLLAGHEKVNLDRDDWLTLLTWIDTNGVYLGSFISVHDWSHWGFRPREADMQEVRTIQNRRCAECHKDVDLARPGWIHPRAPEVSLYLLAPLAQEAGGWGKRKPGVFKNTSDADYQTLLSETRKVWDRMRAHPTPGMKELVREESLR